MSKPKYTKEFEVVTYQSPFKRFSVLQFAREVKKAIKITEEVVSRYHKRTTKTREAFREEVAHYLPQAPFRPRTCVFGYVKVNAKGRLLKSGMQLQIESDGIPDNIVHASAIAPSFDKRFPSALSHADKKTARIALKRLSRRRE